MTRVAGNIINKILAYGEWAEEDPTVKALKADPHYEEFAASFQSQFVLSDAAQDAHRSTQGSQEHSETEGGKK
jgi:hypothetical protein